MPFPIRVADVMNSPVITVDVTETAATAAKTCSEQEIGSVVVLDEGEIVGIVTSQDLVSALGTETEPEKQPLSAVLSAPVVTTTPEATVGDAVATMHENDIARLVVLDDGDLAGIVSSDDIVRYVPQAFHRHELTDEAKDVDDHRYNIRHETAYEKSDWEFTCSSRSDEQLSVGDRVEFSKTLTEQDVRNFAAASGDTNRLHLDAEYAAQTRFGERIVHGTLVSGLISAALARLPGLTIYLSQDLSFLAPVTVGDRVTATCELAGELGRNKYELTTDVLDSDGEKLIEGEATVLIDELPRAASLEIETVV